MNLRSERKVVVDTDTGVDDAMALLMALSADAIEVEFVTVVAGNVEFERQVNNAKHVLELTGDADSVPVYEGARSPLQKEYETAEHIHGRGGLGGDLFPNPDVASGDEHAVDRIVEAARADPGTYTLVCIGPLTNLALALQREPNLGDLLDEVWVMGGARRTGASGTPAAEYNFWVDPDAAKIAFDSLEPTVVCWDVCEDHALMEADTFDRIRANGEESGFAQFVSEIATTPREVTETVYGVDGFVVADVLTVAGVVDPEIVTGASRHPVAVDAREGLTRGHFAVDELGATDWEPTARVVTDVDAERFRTRLVDTFAYGDPLRSLS